MPHPQELEAIKGLELVEWNPFEIDQDEDQEGMFSAAVDVASPTRKHRRRPKNSPSKASPARPVHMGSIEWAAGNGGDPDADELCPPVFSHFEGANKSGKERAKTPSPQVQDSLRSSRYHLRTVPNHCRRHRRTPAPRGMAQRRGFTPLLIITRHLP